MSDSPEHLIVRGWGAQTPCRVERLMERAGVRPAVLALADAIEHPADLRFEIGSDGSPTLGFTDGRTGRSAILDRVRSVWTGSPAGPNATARDARGDDETDATDTTDATDATDATDSTDTNDEAVALEGMARQDARQFLSWWLTCLSSRCLFLPAPATRLRPGDPLVALGLARRAGFRALPTYAGRSLAGIEDLVSGLVAGDGDRGTALHHRPCTRIGFRFRGESFLATSRSLPPGHLAALYGIGAPAVFTALPPLGEMLRVAFVDGALFAVRAELDPERADRSVTDLAYHAARGHLALEPVSVPESLAGLVRRLAGSGGLSFATFDVAACDDAEGGWALLDLDPAGGLELFLEAGVEDVHDHLVSWLLRGRAA